MGLEVVPEAVGLQPSVALLVTVHVAVLLSLHTETFSSPVLALQWDGFGVPQYCLQTCSESTTGGPLPRASACLFRVSLKS